MSDPLVFTIPGPPVPWERVANGHVPARTRAYKKHVATCALGARTQYDAGASRRPLGASWRRDQAAYEVKASFYRRPVAGKARRGDVDNLAKSVLDACNDLLWHDDSQVRVLVARIIDCAPGRERVEVSVSATAPLREL